jgi:hypothetical protein
MVQLFRKGKVLGLFTLGIVLLVATIPVNSFGKTTTVSGSDFQSQSFSTTGDWYDYVRQYAAANGYPVPNSTEHAYIYANYVNVAGFQLFYAGLVNATHNGTFVTVPLQTLFEHFKTQTGKDAITASSFISLVSFKENASTFYPNSPDWKDEVYASFSLGVNLTQLTGHKVPSYLASSQVIPLTTTDNIHWTWGLKYLNLNAIWWKVGVNPLLPGIWDPGSPKGLAQCSELTFNYALTVDASAKSATLTASYTVGRLTDLWLLSPSPVKHLNSTGTYDVNGALTTTQTVYQFLQTNAFKLSILMSQKTILASHTTSDKDDSGNSVNADNSTDVSTTSITTRADDGERVFNSNFAAKPTYKLYNYTKDPTETTYSSYNVNTRTAHRGAWGNNPVFWFQNRLMGFLPLFVIHVDPQLVADAKAGLVNFSLSSYLYIISYPTWGGYRINNDPQFTTYFQPASNSGLVTALFLAVLVAAAAGGVFLFLFRKRRVAGFVTATSPTPGPQPLTGPPSPVH